MIGRGILPGRGPFGLCRRVCLPFVLMPAMVAQAGQDSGLPTLLADHPVASVLVALLLLLIVIMLFVFAGILQRLMRERARVQTLVHDRDRMVADLPVGIYEIEDDPVSGRRFSYISERALEMLGVSRDALDRDFYAAFANIHPQDQPAALARNEQAAQARQVFCIEARFIVDDRQRWLNIESRPREQAGKVYWSGYVLDVTERLEAEQQFRVLFEQSPLSIIIHDAETAELLDANRAAWESYGLSSLNELRQRALWAEPPYSESEALAKVHAAARGQRQVFEWCSIDASGRSFWELVSLMPVVIQGRLRVLSTAIDISELHAARQRFKAIFEASPVAIVVQDATTGELLDANEQTWRAYGFESRRQFLAKADSIWLEPPYDRAAAMRRMRAALEQGGDRFEWPSRQVDGRVIWSEVSITPFDLDGRRCALSIAVDVTLRREGERLLRDSENRFRQLLQEIDGVAVQGYGLDGSVSYWNRASEDLYGYSQAEALRGNLLELIIPSEMREGVRENLAQVARGGRIENGELNLMRKDGSRVMVYSSHAVLRPPDRPAELFCVDIDISDRKRHEEALQRIANYDTLTGLPNRNLLSELMREQTARADRSGRAYALCYLDLDEFKPINDRYGHDMGDQVLVVIAERLRRLVRGSDVVARLGGDEFVLILEGLDDPAALQSRLELVLESISEPVLVDELSLQVQASIGVTLYPQDRADPDTLLRHADQAMYLAKSEGRNRFSLFDPALEQGAQRRRQRLLEIEQGLSREEFRLFYHPKVDLRSGEVIGLEALVRWQHPEQGLLAPAAFLDDLAHSELERVFGVYVIEQALGQMSAWLDQGRQLSVSVNISGPHLLHPDFIKELGGALARYPGIAKGMLIIEIVESAAVADLMLAIEVLQQARELGVQVSLDDFGTGYSSLSHLRSLPVDEIKVDQGFVRDMLTDPSDYSIVRSVLGLASAFSLRVVAEGVESAAHIEALQALDCALGQGYVFARPLPAEQVMHWLKEWPQRSPTLITRTPPSD